MKKFIIFLIIALIVCPFAKSKAQLINLVVSVTGKVINEVTKQPVGIDIDVFDDTGKRVNRVNSNSKDGYYFITGLKPGKKYYIKSIDNFEMTDRFIQEKMELDIPYTGKYTEYSKDVLLKPLKKDISIPFKISPFVYNSSQLRNGIDIYLRDEVASMKDNPRIKFEIACYPVNNDDETENTTLTDERAKALKEYFVSKGIDEKRITLQGYAQTDPKNPPPTGKAAKGKKYKGSNYIVIKSF
jgi:outer membrane protein OmpA-like peptidoglycan-associated protein